MDVNWSVRLNRPAGTVYLMPTDTRERILVAMRALLARGGTSAATLENVAAEAGISKGGLLYHFPSKQALYRGLLTRTRDAVAAELAGHDNKDGVVRAYLEYTAPRDTEERGFVTALIDAIRSSDRATDAGSEADPNAGKDAELGTLLAEIFSVWEQPVRDAVDDPVTAELILQCGNGLYLASVFGLPTPDPAVLRELTDRLVGQAGPGEDQLPLRG